MSIRALRSFDQLQGQPLSMGIAAGIIFLLIAGVLGFRLAVDRLKSKVVEALGAAAKFSN